MAASIDNTGTKLLWAEMFMDRNGSGPKMTSHRQMASGTFILKFSPVSQFRRHNLENRKIEDAIFALLIFYATVRCKRALADTEVRLSHMKNEHVCVLLLQCIQHPRVNSLYDQVISYEELTRGCCILCCIENYYEALRSARLTQRTLTMT